MIRKGREGRVISMSALQALEKEENRLSITTFCEALDTLMGGTGIPNGKVTEICGIAGIGKTQLCMQLAANVQIPIEFGGLNGKTIYFDTEGSFSAERMREIANGTVNRINSRRKGIMKSDQVLNNIRISKLFSHQELIGAVQNLEKDIIVDPSIKLVVIDSIAALFRHSFSDIPQRSKLLAGMAQTLRKIAECYNVTIVITNQMTTKITNSGSDDQIALMVPALGESWAHASTNRIILLWNQGKRNAWLCKSPNIEEATCSYVITTDGIRPSEE